MQYRPHIWMFPESGPNALYDSHVRDWMRLEVLARSKTLRVGPVLERHRRRHELEEYIAHPERFPVGKAPI